MATKLQAGVEYGQEPIIREIPFPELRRKPMRHVGPTPEPVTTARIGDRSGKPPRPARTGDQQPDALSGTPDAACDIRHGDETGIGDPDDIDTFDVLDIRDRRQNRLVEAGRFAVEIDVLDSIDPSYRCIIAPGLEKPVDEHAILQVGTIDDQCEVMDWHRLFLPPLLVSVESVWAASDEALYLPGVEASVAGRGPDGHLTPPIRLASPDRITPQRCPDEVGITAQPAVSAAVSAPSISFFGCFLLILLTGYNSHLRTIHPCCHLADSIGCTAPRGRTIPR